MLKAPAWTAYTRLIGGFTAFDDYPDVLWALLYYPEFLVANETVFSNYAGNTLLGEEGVDLFFGCTDWDVTDWDRETEVFVELC